jgi:signal peptidase II
MTVEGSDQGGDLLEHGEATGTTAAPSAAAPERTAAPRGTPRWPVFIGLAVGIVVLDQLSKVWLVWRFSSLDPGEAIHVIGDYLRLIFSHNSGALFGMFRDQALLFGLVSLGVVSLIVWYHAQSGRSLYMSIALGLLLGGAIGNLLDRFRLGYVVDWIDMGIGDIRFWTFNVADAAISTAILLLIAMAVFPAVLRLGGDGSETADA